MVMQDVGYGSYQAAQLAMQEANLQAQIAYQNAMLEFQKYQFNNLSAYQKETLAFQKAQQAWAETMDRAGVTGYFEGKPTFQREQMENQTALGYLNILGGLRGPADYYQYLKVLNSTPQGMRDLVNAAAGKYAMAGYGGANPQAMTEAASLGTLLQDVGGTGAMAAQPAAQAEGQIAGQGGGDAQAQALPSPSQWNAANVNRMTPTQRDMLLGYYESKGWRPEDAQALFRASLPKYAGPQGGAVRI
jgi:hypothetical protein